MLGGGFDLPALEALAVRHNVTALLYRRLKQVPAALIPAGLMQRLHDLYFASALRGHRMTGLLLQTLDLLQESGIQAVPFKGPALAVQAYGDLSLRQYDDLDLLIHEAYQINHATFGHGTIEGCIAFARSARAPVLALVHLQRDLRRDRSQEILAMLKEVQDFRACLPEPGDVLEL